MDDRKLVADAKECNDFCAGYADGYASFSSDFATTSDGGFFTPSLAQKGPEGGRSRGPGSCPASGMIRSRRVRRRTLLPLAIGTTRRTSPWLPPHARGVFRRGHGPATASEPSRLTSAAKTVASISFAMSITRPSPITAPAPPGWNA